MTRRFRLKTLLLTSSSTMGLVLGGAAFAADAPEQVAQAAQAAGTGQLEEVVVTAQKRSENVQQVPIAVTAVTPATLQNIGALKSDELALAVPGLQIQHEIDATTTFIRGIGPNSNGTGEESSVAVYLDDIYIPDGDASIFALSAISGIDVLKGPQGTLFGRNATGGVIQVHTKDPQFEPSADFEGGYGNYATFTGDIYATGKIIDNVASNLAVWITDQQNGWGHDVT